MCFNECMSFKKFFYLDSNNDQEVSFILELTSILHNDFNTNTSLHIKSYRPLAHLIDKFKWNERPVVSEREISQDECWIDFSADAKKHIGSHVPALVSSSCDISGNNVYKIPAHLLYSQLKFPELITSLAWSVARAIDQHDFYISEPQKIITVLSTNEVNEWISLIEATASIIAYWFRYQDSSIKVELLDLSQGIQSHAGKVVLSSEYLVIAKISPTTSQFIKLARTINPESKMIFHGFESASVYFANTSLYGIDGYLHEQDLWIMSCKADAELAKLAWKNIRTEVVPLKLIDHHKNEIEKSDSRKDIFYFGRISEQKNLEASLFAVSLIADEMRKKNRKFRIFGYEDYLGVPNLKIPSWGYLEDLYTLVKLLGIKDLVEFRAAVQVDKMEELLKHGVFLSPSVHSDENFGLVAFRSLRIGTPVILSKWGGHIDLASYFSKIEYVDVYETTSGPEVNPCQIAECLLEVWKENPVIQERKCPFIKLSLEWGAITPMQMTNLKLEVVKRVADAHPWTISKWPLYGKIFKNHRDPNYLQAMRVYGAQKIPGAFEGSGLISPLVSITSKQIKIKDSRLGVLRLSRQGKAEVALKQLGTNKIFHLSFPESSWLWENGYIYSKGDP